jgi:hypothetical protein
MKKVRCKFQGINSGTWEYQRTAELLSKTYIYLVGDFNHLENISQWEGSFPYIMENKIHV